jgi:CYTH domain-containing protein
MYDIILINPTVEEYKEFKTRFPIAKKAEDFRHAQRLAITEFFWVVWNDCKINKDFDFDFIPDEWSKEYIHVFKNGNNFDGLAMVPKTAVVTDREIEHRFFINKKEVDILTSNPKSFDLFYADTYEEYLYAYENSKTEMFWISSKNIKHEENLVKEFYISHHDTPLRKQTHAFIHKVKGENLYNGLFLCTKNYKLSKKEIEHRFPVHRIEHNLIGSTETVYDVFAIDNYDDYLFALENSKTEIFWGTSNNIDTGNFNFDLYFSHDNEYDRKNNHVFIHKVKDIEYKNGVFLFSKHTPVTKKEIEHRFIVNAKEWPIVASGPVQYEKFIIDNYNDYLYALSKSKTEMFWGISSKIKILDTFNFDLYFSHDNEYDRKINHAFIHEVQGKKTYDGVFLFSKHTTVTKKEIEFRHLVNRKEWQDIASTYLPYDVFQIDSFEEYIQAFKTSKTEMFWMTSRNISLNPDFKFDIYYDYRDDEFVTERKTTHVLIHRVEGKDLYNGVFLLSKHTPLSNKEIEHRFPVNRKEISVLASEPVQYEKFVIENYTDYLYAFENSKTEMFWATSNNIDTGNFNFDLYFSHDNEYDRKTNHTFIHRVEGKDLRNGVFLFSKHRKLTEKEINHRFIVNAKEWPIVASGPVQYEKFIIDNYNDYLYALSKSKTEMFWAYSNNLKINNNFKFDLYFSHDNEYDRKNNHVFIHSVKGKDLYNGVFLLSKHRTLSKKEIDYKFIANAKEWPIVASGPVQYEKFVIESYEEYLDALENSKTEMFWATSNNIDTGNFNFDLYFSHDNEYDRKTNHAFIHRVDGKNLYNGVFLFSKHCKNNKKEIEHRFIVNAKEWPIVASGPVQYDIFNIKTYEEYLDAFENSKTEMFWIIPEYVVPVTKFKFDTYFSHDQFFERKINHVYLNGKYNDGIVLCSKYSRLSKKEFDYRFIANKKEVDIIISTPKPYDIVFISYQEPYADIYYKYLTYKFPRAKRVHGIKGIHQAHIEAAKLCETDMFWIVDGDALIDSKFRFDYQVARWDKETVHVWRSINPINDLVYGYGGVKLFPRELTINMDTNKPDMTTSISSKFKAVQEISNTTGFNTDPFNTWKSAFRECTKLSSKIIDRQKDDETQKRLQTWCTIGKDRPFGEYAILGANAGLLYGSENKDDLEKLKKINDFKWLKEQFDATQQ